MAETIRHDTCGNLPLPPNERTGQWIDRGGKIVHQPVLDDGRGAWKVILRHLITGQAAHEIWLNPDATDRLKSTLGVIAVEPSTSTHATALGLSRRRGPNHDEPENLPRIGTIARLRETLWPSDPMKLEFTQLNAPEA